MDQGGIGPSGASKAVGNRIAFRRRRPDAARRIPLAKHRGLAASVASVMTRASSHRLRIVVAALILFVLSVAVFAPGFVQYDSVGQY